MPTSAAAAVPATYASDGNRVDATHVPLVTAPATRGCRSSAMSSKREDRRACGAGEQQDSEASPASSNDQQDANDERERHRRDLGQRQDQLAGRDG